MAGYGGGYEYNTNNNNGNGDGGFLANGNAGGGFSPNGAASNMASPSTGKANREKQSLTPLTILQVLQAPHSEDEKSKVDGVELHQVKVIGAIVDISEHSTNTVYRIEDGTGRLDVKLFSDPEETEQQTERRAKCGDGTYVQVVGNVRVWQNKCHIVAFDMRPISDFNQVTQHFLEAIFARCQNTKGKLPNSVAARGNAMGNGNGMLYGSQNSGYNNNAAQAATPSHGYNSNAMGGGGNVMRTPVNTEGGSNSLEQLVLAVFNGDDKAEGLSVEHVAGQLPQFNIDQIRTAAAALADEGHLYTTTDESHYKSTA